MATSYPGLATHIRKWGLKVVELDNWQNRTAGGTFTPKAIIAHHTAGSANGNAPSLSLVRDGRPGIPGPLSQFVLGRDGTVYLVSGNRANHAGVGGPLRGVPQDSGNRYCWGIEAENTGRGEPWSSVQLNAYYRLCASLCDLMNVSEYSVFAHKEWAPSRKIDPAGIEMNAFRANVKKALDAGLGGVKTPAGDRWLGLTNPPMTGQDVKNVQNVLRAAGNSQVPLDGVYGRVTADVLAVFQKNRGITERGCGPKTWAALRAYIHNR